MLAIRMLGAAAALQLAPLSAADTDHDLARALDGRVAGAAVECVALASIRSSTVVPGVAILYDAGGTIYMNRPTAGSASLEANTILVDLPFSRLCRNDVVELVDGESGMPAGVIFLGEFVPYAKARRR